MFWIIKFLECSFVCFSKTFSTFFFFSPFQRQSLDRAFLRDAVLERLQDDVPEVVAASLKVLEVSLHQGALPLTGQSRIWTTDCYHSFVVVFFAFLSAGAD